MSGSGDNKKDTPQKGGDAPTARSQLSGREQGERFRAAAQYNREQEQQKMGQHDVQGIIKEAKEALKKDPRSVEYRLADGISKSGVDWEEAPRGPIFLAPGQKMTDITSYSGDNTIETRETMLQGREDPSHQQRQEPAFRGSLPDHTFDQQQPAFGPPQDAGRPTYPPHQQHQEPIFRGVRPNPAFGPPQGAERTVEASEREKGLRIAKNISEETLEVIVGISRSTSDSNLGLAAQGLRLYNDMLTTKRAIDRAKSRVGGTVTDDKAIDYALTIKSKLDNMPLVRGVSRSQTVKKEVDAIWDSEI